MKRLLLTALVLSVLMMPMSLRSQEPSRDEKTILNLSADFIASFNDLDWERFRKFFDDEATIIHPAQFPRRLDGRAAYEPAWQTVFDKVRKESGRSAAPYMQLKPLDLEVQMLNDVAIVTFHLDRGKNSIGRRTLVWHKNGDGWKIVHLHASNVDAGDGP